MKKCLVIGAQGYIGSALCQHLQPPDFIVVPIDLKAGLDYRGMRQEIIQDFDAVIWLAGHSSVGQAKADPVGAIDNNLTGLVDLAKKLKSSQQFLYASSASVHDKSGVSNVYDATKRAAESILPFLHHNFWALRFGTVAGPSPVMRLDTMVNAMTYSAMTKGVVGVSNHFARRPILGITDLCNGIRRILDGKTERGFIDMASFNAQVWDVGQHIARKFKVSIETKEAVPTYDFTMCLLPKSKQTLESIVNDLERHFAGSDAEEKAKEEA